MQLTKLFAWRRNQSHRIQWIFLTFLGILLAYLLTSANALDKTNNLALNPPVVSDGPIKFLTLNFEQLPEKQIAIENTNDIYAQYAQPTAKYGHNILGDSIEAEQLVVLRDGVTYTHTLGDQYVFEDIKPRLFDVDNDGQVEIVTIRTHVEKGAGIMIYKIANNTLTEFAWVEEIGTPYRWLNIVAIYDLDGDGATELAWIQTPHIGGILKVAKIEAGKLDALSELSRYSNHSIGERNLCLSVVTKTDSATTFYVPTQDRQQIAGFNFIDGSIRQADTINQLVNFSSPLVTQYGFSNIVQGEDSCVAP